MSLRRSLSILFLTASTASLVIAFAAAGLWIGAGLSVFPGVLFLITRRKAARWMPTLFLCAMVALAAAGVLAGAPAFPMILAATLALGAWDFMSFDSSLDDGALTKDRAPVGLRHLLLLGGALGLGLALAVCAMVLSFRIPFLVMLLIAIAGFVGLDRAVRPRQ